MDRLVHVIYSWLFLYLPCVRLAAINLASDSYKDHVALLGSEETGGVLLGANKNVVDPIGHLQLPIKVKLHRSDSKIHSKRTFIRNCFTVEDRVVRPVENVTAMRPTAIQRGASRELMRSHAIREPQSYPLPELKPPRRKHYNSEKKFDASKAQKAVGSSRLKEDNSKSKDQGGELLISSISKLKLGRRRDTVGKFQPFSPPIAGT